MLKSESVLRWNERGVSEAMWVSTVRLVCLKKLKSVELQEERERERDKDE